MTPPGSGRDAGLLLVIAGPSGVGKGTIVRSLLAREPSLWLSVSATTRPPRGAERDGVEYRFMTPAELGALRTAGGLLESFEVHGHEYGTPREPVERHLAAGDDVVLEIDVQGALAVKGEYPDAVLVFVRPPSPEELRRRLLARGDLDPADVEQRLGAARDEEARAAEFDAVVVNDDVSTATDRVAGILSARRGGSGERRTRGVTGNAG